MTTRVTATEAKAKILSILDDVQSGSEVEITRHGRAIARLVPASGPRALKGSMVGIAMTTASDEDLFETGISWGIE